MSLHLTFPRFFRIKLLPLIVLILLNACQSSPLPPQTPTISSFATSTPEPTLFFQPHQTTPIFSRDRQPWFANVVEPGAILHHESQFHLFFNGFTGWPGKVAIGHATSPDGQTWTLDPVIPILDSATETFDGYTFFTSSALVEDNGNWTLYLYTLAEGRDGAPGQILRATAPSPAGPWTLAPDPALTPSGDGWDALRVTDPSVIRTPDGYMMWFTGANTDRLQATRLIGLATSPDGIHWTKHPDPVLTLGEKGSWDGYRVFMPNVVPTPDGFFMLYKANIKIGEREGFGLATSLDGITWTKYADNPLIEEKTYGLEWLRKGYADLLFQDGVLYLYLEVLEREGGAWAHGNSTYYSNIYLLTHEGLP